MDACYPRRPGLLGDLSSYENISHEIRAPRSMLLRGAGKMLGATVRRAGEEQVKSASTIIDGYSPSSSYKRQPLTVEDYFQNTDNLGKLKNRFEQRRQNLKRRRDVQEGKVQELRHR
jgi:hypothetical protein